MTCRHLATLESKGQMKPYKTITKTVVYKNPWWRYGCDQIELPSGKFGEYHYALTNGSSMVIPQAGEGKLILVRQYRYTGKRDSIEFPCGGMKDGATHDETAKQELLEETGFLAGELKPIGNFNPCNGLLDEICRVYIARQLCHVGAQPDDTENFELVYLAMEEMDALIRNGTIWDGMTLAAWAIARTILMDLQR
jgi:ADP-ribose pyrophosphatase